MRRSRHSFLALLMLLLVGLTACEPVVAPAQASQSPEGVYAVDVAFREFHRLLGGDKILGYPISPAFDFEGVRYQYTENALMQYNPLAPASQQLSLVSLGKELGVLDEPMVIPEQAGVRVVDGYVLYDEFISLYEKYQGTRFAGRPLTQVRINYGRNRIEQYFENVGFYRSLDDPAGEVRLLAYGAWKCDQACREPRDSSALVSAFRVFPEPFISSLARLGPNFAGRPLSEPYTAADGMLEQIYENIVLAANPNDLRSLTLRPIVPALGIAAGEPVAPLDDPRVTFYPTTPEGLGHNVPNIFEGFLTMHGGIEISGKPLTELYSDETTWRQCFENYCLDYDPDAAEALRVRMAPLGARYLEVNPPLNAAYANLRLNKETTLLSVWEGLSLITSQQQQDVSIQVLEAHSQAAIPNLEATVTLTLPDGQSAVYTLPPTDENGAASVILPAIQASNGTLIPYRVCLSDSMAVDSEPLCTVDSYVIWGNP